jgi:hypothetical protein
MQTLQKHRRKRQLLILLRSLQAIGTSHLIHVSFDCNRVCAAIMRSAESKLTQLLEDEQYLTAIEVDPGCCHSITTPSQPSLF